MLIHFATALIMLLLAVAFIFGALLAGKFARPNTPNPVKSEIYECGEPAEGGAWINFNFRFAIIALVFVIFDVEAALMFPVAAVFKKWVADGHGTLALLEILLFVAVLFGGLVYVWAKGDLNWIKRLALSKEENR